jgi:hypothetical protein
MTKIKDWELKDRFYPIEDVIELIRTRKIRNAEIKFGDVDIDPNRPGNIEMSYVISGEVDADILSQGFGLKEKERKR